MFNSKTKKELYELFKDMAKQKKIILEAKEALQELNNKIQNIPRKDEKHQLFLKSLFNKASESINKSINEYNERNKVIQNLQAGESSNQPTNSQAAPQTPKTPTGLKTRKLWADAPARKFKFAPLRKNTEINESHIQTVEELSMSLERKKLKLLRIHQLMEKLEKQLQFVDSRTGKTHLYHIAKLREDIFNYQQDLKAIETNLKIAMERGLTNHSQQNQSVKNRPNLNISRIPRILNDSRELNRSSVASISLVEREAKQNVNYLLKLQQIHMQEIAMNQEKITDYEDQLNDTSDIAAIPAETLEAEIALEKESLKISFAKLQKVNENLMQLCNMVLFRNKNLHYSEKFKNDLRRIIVELKRQGFKTSKIALSIRRPIVIAPLREPRI